MCLLLTPTFCGMWSSSGSPGQSFLKKRRSSLPNCESLIHRWSYQHSLAYKPTSSHLRSSTTVHKFAPARTLRENRGTNVFVPRRDPGKETRGNTWKDGSETSRGMPWVDPTTYTTPIGNEDNKILACYVCLLGLELCTTYVIVVDTSDWATERSKKDRS